MRRVRESLTAASTSPTPDSGRHPLPDPDWLVARFAAMALEVTFTASPRYELVLTTDELLAREGDVAVLNLFDARDSARPVAATDQ